MQTPRRPHIASLGENVLEKQRKHKEKCEVEKSVTNATSGSLLYVQELWKTMYIRLTMFVTIAINLQHMKA